MSGVSKSNSQRPQRKFTKAKKAYQRAAVLAGAMVALIGYLQAFKSYGFSAWSWWQSRQPYHDERVINSLTTGIAASRFESLLKTPKMATLRSDIDIAHQRVSDRLFILDTVYVEEFVDEGGTVLAYTVTANRTPEPKHLDFNGKAYNLGSTTFANSELASVDRVAMVCGAHISSIYLIGSTHEAELNRTIAVGHTSAGYLGPNSWTGGARLCPDSPMWSMLRPGRIATPAKSNRFVIDTYKPSRAALPALLAQVARADINSVCITSYGVQLVPQMISLHPEVVSEVDVGRGR